MSGIVPVLGLFVNRAPGQLNAMLELHKSVVADSMTQLHQFTDIVTVTYDVVASCVKFTFYNTNVCLNVHSATNKISRLTNSTSRTSHSHVPSPLTCKDAINVVYDVDRFVFSINGHIGYPQQTMHVWRRSVLKFNPYQKS